MTSEKTGARSELRFDSDEIMDVAKVIRNISEDLEEKILAQRRGAFYLGPALTALGIEFAIKALQCHVRKGAAPDKGHDLLKLFQKLPEEVQVQLEDAWANRESPRGEMDCMAYLDMNRLENLVSPRGSRLEEVLKAHRGVFTKWRYGYELLREWYGPIERRKCFEFGERRPQTAALRHALKIIVEIYHRQRGATMAP